MTIKNVVLYTNGFYCATYCRNFIVRLKIHFYLTHTNTYTSGQKIEFLANKPLQMSHTGPLNWFISFDERKYCISLVFFKSQCRFFILVQRGSERKTDKKGKKLNRV